MSESENDAEKILESLSQEERLKLLERLIQGATEIKEESMTVEERLERLEGILLGGHHGSGKHKRVIMRVGRRPHLDDDFGCFCC